MFSAGIFIKQWSMNKMGPDNLALLSTTIGGGFFIGITLGYFVKKIIKILMFVVGGIIGLLLYLQQQQIISVNIQRLEASSTFILTSVYSSLDKMTQIGDVASLGILLSASITAGFTIGLMKA